MAVPRAGGQQAVEFAGGILDEGLILVGCEEVSSGIIGGIGACAVDQVVGEGPGAQLAVGDGQGSK